MSQHRETRDPLGPRVRVNYVSTNAYIISEMTLAQCKSAATPTATSSTASFLHCSSPLSHPDCLLCFSFIFALIYIDKRIFLPRTSVPCVHELRYIYFLLAITAYISSLTDSATCKHPFNSTQGSCHDRWFNRMFIALYLVRQVILTKHLPSFYWIIVYH